MLEVSKLCAGYGTVPVLRDVDLAASAGEIVLVAGENGAGKTTLAKAISGLIRPQSGKVVFDGRDVTGRRPEELVRQGLRLVLDGHRVFPDIPVRDNLRLGAAASGKPFDASVERVLEVFPILHEKWTEPARGLSGGQQQILALGQAFCAKPRVLICDEPSMGLAEALMPQILEFLRDWSRDGTAVIVIEQNVALTLPYVDRAILLDRGSVALGAPAAEFAARVEALGAEDMARMRAEATA